MKRLIAPLLILLLFVPTALAGGGSNTDNIRYAVVSNPDPADRLNLRMKPDTGAISLGKFYNGTPVTILRTEGKWAYVTLYKDFEGWMHTDYLAIGEDAGKVESAMPTVTVISPTGKTVCDSMLSQPSVSAPFAMGSQLEVMGVMEDWLFVRSGESIAGFTKNSGTMPRVYFSSPDATPPARVSVVPTPTPSPTPLPAAADGRIYARTAAKTFLYEDESLTKTLASLEPGQTLEIKSASGSVCRTTVNGMSGWIDASYLSFSSDFGPGYADVSIEGARRVAQDEWICFAAIHEATYLYADRAMTQPIGRLEPGQFIRVLNDMYSFATVVIDNRVAGYVPVVSFTIHTAKWPFYINQPSAAVANPVPSDRLHLRESPYKDAASLGRYYNGAVVTLLDNFSGRNEWTHVDVGGVQGYMMSEYLDFSPDIAGDLTSLHIYEIANPNTGDLHLREAPDTSSKSLGLYKNGTLAAVIGVTGDWVHVICGGRTGFMLHKHLKTAIGTSFDPYQ